MRVAERRRLRERFGFACGYCGVTESDDGALLTTDHFQPRTQGGSNEPDNLVYACHACNEFKGDYRQATGTRRILHLGRDDLSAYVAENADATLRGLTPTGVFHIERLRLNRPALLEHRRARRRLATAQAEQRALLEQLGQLESQVNQLTMQLEALQND